ncbi:septal ring lytic transglycosylase RlpA family protein [Luteimonas granuli]|uniref:Endolytic peptidoglycan transglycosylase RlpA n=1 Tax=Luteimonas granuli TaxID=1176533 RepID=A0A518N4X6_9GAMM|nr:septal ring lytic transglycosylase RlpA family protein [Luteimonas granuli]QDW66972.1 septal ring lytic transglycosylase RlpA family protein [Luteimonas granuli]
MSVGRAKSACRALAALVVLLAGCAGAPKREEPPVAPPTSAVTPAGPRVSPYAPAQEDPSTRGDYVAGGLYKPGVADTIPDYLPDVDAIPEPEVVALPRSRYGNGPTYTVLGKSYRVLDEPEGFVETGLASYYGQKFHGRRTSNQEVYDMYAFTAAHKSLPLPSFARVTNLENGRSVVVRVNDRGPFHAGRVVDLSYAAAVRIGVHPRGTARVEVRALSPGENARHAPDTRVAAVEPSDGQPPGVRAATGGGQPAPPSAMDGLVAALPAAAAATAATVATAAVVAGDDDRGSDNDWRFDMTRDGRAMTADEFDAWMKVRRVAVATGSPGTPDPAVDAPVAPPPPTAKMIADAAGSILLQIAAFGSRDNAERALAMLRGAGIAGARLHDGIAAGKPVWRLRVGPVEPAGLAELRDRVAGLGFGTPHPVRE